MIGKTLSHYRIVDQLGRGGLGIVSKAEDTKLDRTVALKLLPPHALISEDDRARFYREARAAAALNHANIAHVYEIDEAQVDNGESPGRNPHWSHDGKFLYFLEGNMLMRVEVEPARGRVRFGNPEMALRLDRAAASYALTEDDRGVYYTGLPAAEGDAEQAEAPDPAHPPVNVVVNWFEHVQRLSPIE